MRGDSMRCRDCPYGIEDFTLRTEMYKSVYGEYPDEDRTNESEQFVWCDKVGGKVYSFGHCSDWYEQDDIKKHLGLNKCDSEYGWNDEETVRLAEECSQTADDFEHNDNSSNNYW
jgi:hypothetical protein